MTVAGRGEPGSRPPVEPSGQDDGELAARLARAAGELLLAVRDGGLLSGRELGQAGDQLSQRLLARMLRVHRPDDAVLSEEASDDLARLAASRVWVIDPLDGTSEYGAGRDDWAVHVALTLDGAVGPAAVALPAHHEVFATSDGVRAVSRAGQPLRIAVSRSRAPQCATVAAQRLGAELVPMGSAGFKAMSVLTGQVDAYVHAGGQYEWDSAAPAGVALAAGLHASRIDGSPLQYNRPDPALPDLLICSPELAGRLLEALAR